MNLQDAYSREDFINFVKDFLPNFQVDIRKGDKNNLKITNELVYLGESKELKLTVFELTHTSSSDARVALSNDGFRVLKNHGFSRALIAYRPEKSNDWRLSLLTATLGSGDKGQVTQEFSSPRRYSFFLGPNAKINTPNRFLIKNGQIKNFEDLLSRFNVEIVTKEFFENYRKLFDRLLAYLNKDHAFQSFAGRNGVETANFAKKLLGQIVFLYFLQRKGWLGAKKGDSISSGDKNFLRSLFNKSVEKKTNFYNEYLEKLFYGALNKSPEKAGSYYRSYFDCQIPFLNGGLFEPPQNYDWEGEFLMLPDKLFSKDPKNPSHGDGILDIFDLYNFTVDESDFLDKEVSVDPEMLGKVFENLLEENLRKGKGTYYTPREIVNYMCEESLVNYLSNETGLIGEEVKNKYFPAYNVLGDEKNEVRDVSVSEQIIESLKSIRIVDPACGSGAFLVGMLQQITHLRYDLERRSRLLGSRSTSSSEYEIKKQTIQNCIYGVDIDPGAVDIAKLRLWLSLVVDYSLEEIEPLPNLDYKIMQGNSLLEELVLSDTIIKLYDRQAIDKALGSKRMKNLFDEEKQLAMFDDIKKEQALKNMRAFQLQYFSQSDAGEKKRIKSQIEKIERDLVKASVKAEADKLSAQRLNIRTIPSIGLLPEDAKRLMEISTKENQIMAVLDELEKSGTKPFFLWHLHFADVFEQKGGFDVVIGNPPYVSAVNDNANRNFRASYRLKYEEASGSFDLYILFLLRGVELSNINGSFSWIIPNKYLVADYAKKTSILLEQNGLYEVDSVSNLKVFGETGVYPIILLGNKLKKTDCEIYDISHLDDLGNKNNYKIRNKITTHFRSIGGIGLRVISGATGFEAQRLKQIIFNEGHGVDGIQFVVSGSIDRYTVDNSKVRYMGDTYSKPVAVYKSNVVSENKWNNWRNPKIVIAGMTKKIEAIYSDQPLALGVGVYAIISFKNFNPRFLLSLLNSNYLTYFLKNNFRDKHLAGGYLAINKSTIEALPIPELNIEEQKQFIEIVDKILAITGSEDYLQNTEKQEQMKGYEKQIDQLVYELYELSDDEIKIVEGMNRNETNNN